MKKSFSFWCSECRTKKTSVEPGKKMCSKCEKNYIEPGTITLFNAEGKTTPIPAVKIPGLILPRNYLSYSQMTCWMSSPARFRREYFENGRKLNSKYLTFGKGIAKMIEEWNYKELLPGLNVLGKPEHKILGNVAGVPILSFIDDYFQGEHIFQEFKTGKVPWTQAKVQKHEQLPFYAAALKWETGVMPKKCNLIWIETSDEPTDPTDFWAEVERPISVTGNIISFTREFDPREIERMEDLIVKVATEISDAYKQFILEI